MRVWVSWIGTGGVLIPKLPLWISIFLVLAAEGTEALTILLQHLNVTHKYLIFLLDVFVAAEEVIVLASAPFPNGVLLQGPTVADALIEVIEVASLPHLLDHPEGWCTHYILTVVLTVRNINMTFSNIGRSWIPLGMEDLAAFEIINSWPSLRHTWKM